MKKEKILLGLLPYWTALIPPLGISCLKSYLEKHHYNVAIFDSNVDDQFKEFYDNYFNKLKEFIPAHARGNFYSIGHDVMRNHMMAHLHYSDEREYIDLVKVLIDKTYFCRVADDPVRQLITIVTQFYSQLEASILQLLEREKPDVFGLSVYSDTLPASLFAFKITRLKFPHIKTVMGGGIFADQLSIGSPNLDYFLKKTPYIDNIIIGEGETLFLKLLSGDLPQYQRVYTLKDIDMKILDMDTLDIPNFFGLKLEYYPYLAGYSSRSCPFQCNFCSETVNWGKYRRKNSKKIVRELLQLHKQYSNRLFLMGDSLLNPVITELAAECIEQNALIYYDGYLRADKHVGNLENTMLWRRGGFYRARLGVESGSPRILDLMGKRIEIEEIEQAIYSLAYAGIKTTTYWVTGYPGETEEDFQQTLDLIEKLKDNIYEAECKPFYYFLSGQVKSQQWANQNESLRLYPENAKEMLILETWILNTTPTRQEAYDRMRRLVQHCKKLGIPNPYSLNEIYQADERWKTLHKNAVPAVVSIKGSESPTDERYYIKMLNAVSNSISEDLEFGF